MSLETFFRKKTQFDDAACLLVSLHAASSRSCRRIDHSATAAASARRETTYKGTRSVPQALGGTVHRGSTCRLQQVCECSKRAARASDAYKTKEKGRQGQGQRQNYKRDDK